MISRRLLVLAGVSLLIPMGFAVASQSGSAIALTRTETTPALLAQAAPATPPGDGDRPDRGPERIFQQLNLTADQQQQIQTIHQQARSQGEGLHQQLEQAEEQMRSLLGGNASQDQLRQQHQQVQNLRQQMDNQRFETMLQVREVLTAEQRTQFATLMGQHRGGPGRGRPQAQ